jgi:hypothetical protein
MGVRKKEKERNKRTRERKPGKMKNATNVSNVVARVSDDVVRERKVYIPELFFFFLL